MALRQKRRARRARKGFTLMEVLLVLAILVILGTTVGFFFSRMQSRSFEDLARNQINAFKTPVQTYKLDVGTYPPNLEALVEKPAEIKDDRRWRGPYQEDQIPLDPWGNAYQYEPGADNYRVYSLGPDGQAGTDDDIANRDSVS